MNPIPERIRVLSVDDHPLIRDGVAGLLASAADMVLVGEAADGREAVEKYRLLQPSVVLMDIQMPVMNGLEALVAIRREFPQARVLLLTTYSGDVLAQRALKAGARAYLLKSLVRTELLDAIRAVAQGHIHISPAVAMELARYSSADALSSREVRVLESIASGLGNKSVARELDITEGTVKSHVKNILAKLCANDRTHAVTLGLKRGIIDV
ncbi:response regulator [Variovorax sp. HJSM1_2]|uniref:response regulator n=1 Tax=Variovorax sp. HJSM1_2 TaxID=3366263 RepID=UPI003BE55981